MADMSYFRLQLIVFALVSVCLFLLIIPISAGIAERRISKQAASA
jgi:hypothetical protein